MFKKNKNPGEEEVNFFGKKENWWILIGIVVIIVAIATPFIILHQLGWKITYKQFDELGVVGDFFGGTTVGLFTLASIMFVIAAIVMQKKELELQRKELAQTRKEFETGNNTAKVQQIDNAFFNMLSLNHQIVNHIMITESQKTYNGREAITELRDICKQKLAQMHFFSEKSDSSYIKDWQRVGKLDKNYLNKVFDNFDTISQEMLNEVYEDFHNKHGNSIGHYVRNNYRIVKFIVNNVADDKTEQERIKNKTGREPIIGDKRYYFGMLRAQWSNAEFELILINSLYKENHKFKDLILEYDVLDMEETDDDEKSSENFKLKDSMDKFKAFKKLIEVRK
ncbi:MULTISPECIES: putative phage abortive infection protein [Priestia]|uniref:putative phage abortive infection protein n=1 Tax=Priestia TaxID=2800373 RepID=UPI0021D68458|nr:MULTISPECIES: putative phage abortive infection protein [Priestia]MCU7711133.1 putative phage abortive infection protein [Priestia megaterium]MCW1044140.1 putative phage abortive infection protein [Priestia sp. JV24]